MIAALAKGFALGLLLSISVGPVIFSVIKQSLNNGHKGGFSFIAGVSASDITVVLICNLFTSLFQSAMSHELVIGSIGSAFLILMGLYTIFLKKVATTDDGRLPSATMRKRDMLGIFLAGYFMNLLNPGVLLFWIGASTAVISGSEKNIHPDEYIFIAFAVCLLINLIADISKVMLAGKIREKLNPHNIHIINRVAGLIYLVFGVVLIYGIYTNKLPH
ncbi:LysE family translocator [Limnovirga soli]|jgi:threonine/homoserine/homoserine lactone efflux protein|uniref:Lysine transporter LysE n=1 Tax=Limnovirga soli TaxID=2656915 RepID=A0A8J8FGD1_9BACT|nr:LysE family translocator [Limnovirga soli]NNV56468.1 lysine transporter LysE [Limnovirga soli]